MGVVQLCRQPHHKLSAVKPACVLAARPSPSYRNHESTAAQATPSSRLRQDLQGSYKTASMLHAVSSSTGASMSPRRLHLSLLPRGVVFGEMSKLDAILI